MADPPESEHEPIRSPSPSSSEGFEVDDEDDAPGEVDLGATMVDLGSAADPDDPLIGQSFSGCTIVRKLGEGGMGSVYLARRERDRGEVVVKFLAKEQAANPTWRARFLREAQVMQQIAHPNVVAIESLEGEGDHPHMVMEFVDGESLEEALVARQRFEPMEAVRIAREIALGLAHAHASGVIHRDIKPGNVLVSHAGEVKVLDFGLAKNVEIDDGLSLPGQVLGTPHYMAPEQWGDHRVDARCDVYSLGATLFHLVTGQTPFAGRNPTAISRKAMRGEFPRPRELAPELPEDVELAILHMMMTDRAYRTPSAQACADELGRVLAGRELEVPRLVRRLPGGREQRLPLLPQEAFVLGRDDTCDIVVVDRSVSRQHARIERGITGFVLHDLGSTYGTHVGGMRVQHVVLKDQDEVRLGKVSLVFRDGHGQAALSTRRISAEELAVQALPAPFIEVLIERGDRRAVLSLLERLPEDDVERRVEACRRRVRELLGGDLGEQVGKRVEAALRRRRGRVPHYLFTITHENLGDDVEAWLGWWDNARVSYPAQAASRRAPPSVRLHVLRGEDGEPRTIALSDEPLAELGREESCGVQLRSRSVSRLHATILRLQERLAIRDEGSRFGTLLNGARVRMAFLRPGDRVTLGQVELEVEVTEPEPEGAEAELIAVEPDAFFALAELGHLSAATGLVYLLDVAAETSWVDGEARAVYPDPEEAEKFAKAVRRRYGVEAQRARRVLPTLLGEDRGDDLAGWLELLRGRELPPQVLPQGWFPSHTDSGSYRLQTLG